MQGVSGNSATVRIHLSELMLMAVPPLLALKPVSLLFLPIRGTPSAAPASRVSSARPQTGPSHLPTSSPPSSKRRTTQASSKRTRHSTPPAPSEPPTRPPSQVDQPRASHPTLRMKKARSMRASGRLTAMARKLSSLRASVISRPRLIASRNIGLF